CGKHSAGDKRARSFESVQLALVLVMNWRKQQQCYRWLFLGRRFVSERIFVKFGEVRFGWWADGGLRWHLASRGLHVGVEAASEFADAGRFAIGEGVVRNELVADADGGGSGEDVAGGGLLGDAAGGDDGNLREAGLERLDVFFAANMRGRKNFDV